MIINLVLYFFFFFFQAEDGIRDIGVTGVQTCALPICLRRPTKHIHKPGNGTALSQPGRRSASRAGPGPVFEARESTSSVALLERAYKIGRASCRERV